MSAPLELFLATMKGFFESELDAAGVESRLGRSASGTARLALYAELVRRQKESVLDHFFRAARRAAEAQTPGSWASLREAYLSTHRPDHWEPNQFARPMLGFIEARVASGALSAFVHELADYAWIRFAAMLAPHADSIRLEGNVFVREYLHDVSAYARAAEAKIPAVDMGAPTTVRSTLLVCRSRVSGQLAVVHPSLAALLVVAEQASGAAVKQLPAGVTAADLRAEEKALLELGVLGAVQRATR